MKRKSSKIKLFFASILICFACIFTFKTLPSLEVSSFASSKQTNLGVEATEITKNILTVEIPSLTTTFKENTTNTDITSNFEKAYKGLDYELSVEATSSSATNFTYQWQYSSDNTEFNPIEGETNSLIKLKNCNQSGYYNCVITNADDITQVSISQSVNFVITQKEVEISSLTAKNKEYDGNNNIELDATLSGVLDGDSVVVNAIGKTATANADLQKLVTFNSATLTGEDAENYKLSSNIPQSQLIADITKKDVAVVWQTVDNKTSYVYDTTDQIGKISAHYLNVLGEKVKLAFSITGYNTFGRSKQYTNEFLNTGTYQAVAILGVNEANYNLTNLELNLTITRATPQLTIENTVFTYTGFEQDASRCVTINNDEQELTFTNNYFTTVLEGNGKQVTVVAELSLNYFEVSKTFAINVVKADAVIDISGVKKDYVYNGDKQTINSGAIINNQEQTLAYSNNTFMSVSDGNGKKVTVFAAATENYNYVSQTFTINVEKATIDTSKWTWYYLNDFTYTGNEQSVRVINYNPTLVTPIYTGATQTNVGTYTATVRFELHEPENYNEVSINNLTWKIKKATVSKPNCQFRTSVYTGEEQTLSVPTNGKYSVSENTYKDAGIYFVSIALKDNSNYQWEDGTVDNLSIKWIIEKAIVEVPAVKNQFTYTGKTLSLGLESNDLYEVLDGEAVEVGKYSTRLILKDSSNYQWADTDNAYVTINWEILEQPKNATLPIVAILISFITIVLIAVYATLHSTKVIKHRRKQRIAKQELEKQRKANKQAEEAKLAKEKDVEVKVENKVEKVEKKTETKVEEKPTVVVEKKEFTPKVVKEEKEDVVQKSTTKNSLTVKEKSARKTRATTKKKKVVAKKRNDARKKATEEKRAAEKKIQTKQKVKAKKEKELEKAKEAKKQAKLKAKAKLAKSKQTSKKKNSTKTSVK